MSSLALAASLSCLDSLVGILISVVRRGVVTLVLLGLASRACCFVSAVRVFLWPLFLAVSGLFWSP